MAEHTPGPWTVQDNLDLCGEFWISAKHHDGLRVSIAAVRPGCDEANEIGCNEANARLIAAAPELLDALERLLNVCSTHPSSEEHLFNARDVVDRAKGLQ